MWGFGLVLAGLHFPCSGCGLAQVGLCFLYFSMNRSVAILGLVVLVLLIDPSELGCCLGCEVRLMNYTGSARGCRVVTGNSVGMGLGQSCF